ncbi:MAG: CDP-diacylglycerol--glycerol-3-phosphate 3-phosphatidyltransferase [Rhodothermaceae bacterium]|nr:MAG: CDP-diacylglycerol--glycerol-3-phosphate 3-phosphatidyltransferase [Rhodothermaceae bacterium]
MKYVPNTLTIIRILITPVLLVLLMTGTLWGTVWAFILFVLAAISDYLDGKLARHFQVGSRLGQFLDPLADKVLVLGAFVVLAVRLPDVVTWWGVALIAVRDLLVTGLRTWAEARGTSLRTLPIAKLKTTAQLVFLIGILLVMVFAEMQGAPGDVGRTILASPVLYGLFLAVVVITVFTGWPYVRQALVRPDREGTSI